MIRRDNHLLVLIGEHKISDVFPQVFTVLHADSQETPMHEVRVSDTDMMYLLNPDEVVHVQGIKVDKRKIQLLHVKHVEYVIESMEELLRGECVDVRQLPRNVNHVEWVSWIFRGDEAFLYPQHIIMKSLRSLNLAPGATSGRIG